LPTEFTPYHEAGHALAHVAAGVPIAFVSIAGPECRSADGHWIEERVRIAIALAASIVEDGFRGEDDPTARTREFCHDLLDDWSKSPTRPPWLRHPAWDEDFGRAVTDALRLTAWQRESTWALLEEVIAEVHALALQGRAAVEALATALRAEGDIDGDRATAILRGALEEPV
jgi:hypothetical protein